MIRRILPALDLVGDTIERRAFFRRDSSDPEQAAGSLRDRFAVLDQVVRRDLEAAPRCKQSADQTPRKMLRLELRVTSLFDIEAAKPSARLSQAACLSTVTPLSVTVENWIHQAQVDVDKSFGRRETRGFQTRRTLLTKEGVPMRRSLIARAGLIAAVVALAGGTAGARIKGQDPGDVLTVATVGNGTAQELTIPDLGTLRVECSGVSAEPRLTLTGGAPFDVLRITADGNGQSGLINQTTWTNAFPFAFISDTLWMSNVQGLWRFEYYGRPTNPSGLCRASAVVLRIS